VNLLPLLFYGAKESLESKSKPAGVARQQLHFLCIDKACLSKLKAQAKESDPNALPAARGPEGERG
jgi:hypothetical protein